MRVGVVQMCSGVLPTPNLISLEELVHAAATAGARYVLTPEMSVAFAKNRAGLLSVVQPFEGNEAVDFCEVLAKKLNITLHLGSLAILRDDGMFANRSIVFGPDGSILATYDKIHLFDADPPNDRPYRESDTYYAGETAQSVVLDGFQLGMTICFDVRFPALYAALAEGGCDVLAIPAAFTVPTGKAHWEVLLRARAIETGSFVLAAAQTGLHENGRETYGHSMIIDPWGKILAENKSDEPGVLVTDIDIKAVQDARLRLPALVNRRAFSLSVNHNLPE